jgi:uncharacterized repeat protein (TIGR03803 family)
MSPARGSRLVVPPLVGLLLVSCIDTWDPAPASYTVGGTVSGLAGGSVVLVNNDMDSLAVSSNGTFAFTLASATGGTYSVAVATEPGDQVCTVANGDGAIGSANVTTVSVTCVTTGESPLYAFAGANGSYPDSGLTQGTDGNFYGTTTYGGASNAGTVYRVTPQGQHTVIYSFTTGPADGQYPASGLELGSDGVFYATTTAGGAYGKGTFFKITQEGALTNLYSFGANGTGADPQGITLMPDGHFYGTTSYGGASDLGTVYRMTADGVHTLLYSFQSGADGQLPAAGLSPYADGHLYGVTYYGGARNRGTIFRIATDGTGYATLYSFGSGSSDGQYPGTKLRQTSDGYLYGSTGSGGAFGFGTIFRYNAATGAQIVHSFAGEPNDGSLPSSRLRQGTDGHLYGVTYYGGRFDSGTFFRLTTAGDYSLLYSFSGGAGGQGPNSSLLTGSDGYFYGTTVTGGPTNNGTIYRIRP